MQASQSPSAFVAPFANSAGAGFIRTIPANSQIGITAGAASLHDGFPPVCFVPVAAGGTPPWGQDTNGILNQITAGVQWTQVGGTPVYNSTFATAIGGYPNGAILQSADGTGFWRSTTDNNTSNPDSGGANWLPMFFSTSASVALSNATVTLSAAQYSKPIIVLTGTLTANVVLVFPSFVQEWSVINATIGPFGVFASTVGGTGVQLSQGSKSQLRGNGTNVLVDALQVGTATQGGHAINLGQADSTFGQLSGANTWTGPNTFADPVAVGSAVSPGQAVSISQFVPILSGSGAFEIPMIAGGVPKNFIIQWGTATITSTGNGVSNLNVTLSTPFPTAHLFALANFGGVSPPGGDSCAGFPVSLSAVEISIFTQNPGTYAVSFISIGY